VQLLAAIEQQDRDEAVRAIVLHGARKVFSAGARYTRAARHRALPPALGGSPLDAGAAH
jgi:enoyl-CoA hydratase/carnithine racemase